MPLDGQVASIRATVLYNGALQALMLGRPVTALFCFQVRPPERTGLCRSHRCSCVAMPRSRSAPLAHAPRVRHDCICTARPLRCGLSTALHTCHAVLERICDREVLSSNALRCKCSCVIPSAYSSATICVPQDTLPYSFVECVCCISVRLLVVTKVALLLDAACAYSHDALLWPRLA